MLSRKIAGIFLTIVLLIASLTLQAALHEYASHSALKSGKFVKISVKESGVYKITYEDLSSWGLNPAKISLFGFGGAILDQNFLNPKIDDLPEIPVYEFKGSDNVFNAGDYILFYAQGVIAWKWDSSKGMFLHQVNQYANEGCYFLSSDAGTQKRMILQDIQPAESDIVRTIDRFNDYQLWEEDLQTLSRSGKEFYGVTFNDILSYTRLLTFPNAIKESNAVKVRLDLAATSPEVSNFNLTLNNLQNNSLYVSAKAENDHYEKARSASGIFSFTPTQDDLNFKLSYAKSSTTSIGYLNFLEVNALRSLIMTGNTMKFQQSAYLNDETYSKYVISNMNDNIMIWDISDRLKTSMVNKSLNASIASFYSRNDALKQFIAIDLTKVSSLPKPVLVGDVPNQDLHGIEQADLVIISHPDFLAQAEILGEAHRDKDDMTVSVVTTDQVYNEFSSGTHDATAYRWLMKMLYDRALSSGKSASAPKYLLLFGRGQFDNRRILPTSSESFVKTYQADNSLVETLSYVTDDYFGFLEDSEGTQIPAHSLELGIGRIPVQTAQEAKDVVSKLVSYMNNDRKGNWKNQLCYLADDGDISLHMRQADSVASFIGRLHPSFQINKIYLDAYQQVITASGETYPVARSQFHNLIHQGMLLLDYTGHAGATGWTNEQILSLNDVKNMSNVNLPLWIGATCDFLQFDIPTVSAGEHVLLNPLGGGVGIISAARPVYASQNYPINRYLNQYLFAETADGDHMRIGDAVRLAKNSIGTEINKLCYVFMGDPAMKLNYPTKYKIVTTSINEGQLAGNDTLRALSEAGITGYVSDLQGNKVTDYNGLLHATIFDKVQRITTLNNDGNGNMTYNDRPNKLFSGKAEVINGDFSFSFMLPKDIKYNYGGGRISYYATDTVMGDEAQGYFEKFLIGGSNPNVIDEENGPEVFAYLNTNYFTDGGQVNEKPMFYAQVSDENGINYVGSGIGHDIMLTVDEDPSQSYILNDYFESSFNTYKDGFVKYKLPELKAGKHTLSFRVWDLMNNSSVQNINFEVVKGLQPTIFRVYNYPNPVQDFTRIVVEHDQPETIMQTTVQIYDMAGRMVWSFDQASADDIQWDLTGANGKRVPRGLYLYKVNIKSNDKTVQSRISKMMVLEP